MPTRLRIDACFVVPLSLKWAGSHINVDRSTSKGRLSHVYPLVIRCKRFNVFTKRIASVSRKQNVVCARIQVFTLFLSAVIVISSLPCYSGVSRFAKHTSLFSRSPSCISTYTAVCDCHLLNNYWKYTMDKRAHWTTEGAITPNPSLTRMAACPITAWYEWNPARFQQTPPSHVNTDQSYPGIRTARMCRQPGCRYFVVAFSPPHQVVANLL